MAVKKCCVEKCCSSSTRKEDIGVTYHKFPKVKNLRDKWTIVTQYKHNNIDNVTYVCSRHFCKSDFKLYQDSKYVLKSDAVPSIFAWVTKKKAPKKMEAKTVSEETNHDEIGRLNTSGSSKDSEVENLEAIRKYIEEQEKEIQESEKQNNRKEQTLKEERSEKMDIVENRDPMVIATSVMDMILSQSEAKIANNKNLKPIKTSLSPKDKGNSMALSVGSKVEAKDFSESWYPAEILEVDYDEMEVLVHYESHNKHDEWINVNSPRLRPLNGTTTATVATATADQEPATKPATIADEIFKDDDITKPRFVVGERCLARWRDNRRFVATVSKDYGNGHFEVIFDDGFQWKCTKSRLYKLKTSFNSDESSMFSCHSPTPIISNVGPSIGQTSGVSLNITPLPIFHTHLFDPTRDYLGSKSERREMKRKLNIKEIFNIGQKKRKKQKSPTEKVIMPKKPKSIKHTEPKIVKFEKEIKIEIPDAVASIIGMVSKEEIGEPSTNIKPNKTGNRQLDEKIDHNENKEDNPQNSKIEKIVTFNNDNNANETQIDDVAAKDKDINATKVEIDKNDEVVDETEERETETTPKSEIKFDKNEVKIPEEIDVSDELNSASDNNSDLVKPSDLGFETRTFEEPVLEEELKLEKFDMPDQSKQEVIEKMKEVINKLEEGLIEMEKSPSLKQVENQDLIEVAESVKKADEVEIVKGELAKMKLQVEEMRQKILSQPELPERPREMPESFLLPGEWCCRWVDGDPIGVEVESEPKDPNVKQSRRSIKVEDKRLPLGWTKYMVQRSVGQSAGKWDVVLIGPENRRFHTKTDMRSFLLSSNDDSLQPYEYALLDFGVHLKLSRRMGWVTYTKDPPRRIMSPLKRHISRKRTLEKKEKKVKKLKKKIKAIPSTSSDTAMDVSEEPFPDIVNCDLEDGYVYCGSLKVQIIENLLRCPAEGCLKNFRNNTLLQMHIKHYHREMRKMLGTTPKVLDLAKKRTKPTFTKPSKRRYEHNSKIIKVKIPRPPKRVEHQEPKPKLEEKQVKEEPVELQIDIPKASIPKIKVDSPVPRSQDSPKIRQALQNKPVKRPKVLLPVRRPDPEPVQDNEVEKFEDDYDVAMETEVTTEVMDFEAGMSTHTITKPLDELRKKYDKKRKGFAMRPVSEEDEWAVNSDFETRSSFPGSGTPDSKSMDKIGHQQAFSSESNNEEQKSTNMYMYTETGERVKIEHMKREEIINCHCGFREEDGLMVQCELCLCWQHALCHNIQREAEVPEKYTCSICLNPRRGRRSKRFLHDQDRLYEGLLPGAKPCEFLRRSHELSGNLLRIQDALHALRVKHYVATKKDHPKLYLWAKDWDKPDTHPPQNRLNSDYTDLNIIINNIDKENMPVKPEEIRVPQIDMRMQLAEDSDQERFSNNTSNSLFNLATALSSPSGGPSLDLPITTSELERLAKSVQEQEVQRNVQAPQPEAAIENSVCRERLLQHVQRFQAAVDSRLDSIEAQVAELESQDPSFEDDETADFFPRTKQTIQMLMRDLDTLEELGVIT